MKPVNAKYDVKIFEILESEEKGTKYAQTCVDLIVPGYKKKDGTVVPDQLLPRFSFVEFNGEPTEEDIIVASNKSEPYGNLLQKRKDNWGKFGTNAKEGRSKLVKEYQVKAKKEDNR